MNQVLAMCALRPGEAALLRRMETPQPLRLRLRELGFVEGAALRCLLRSPGGGLAAYAVGGAVFALRDDDAARLFVEREGKA